MKLEDWVAFGLDPSLMMKALAMEPDPWQERLLRSTSDRILLLCSRQLGKSTATALLGYHSACFHDEALILLVSRSERQSTLLFEKVRQYHSRLQVVPAAKELALSIKLTNGSEIVALPGDPDTIRGFSNPFLVIIDEASRVPDGVLTAVVPMLVNGGRLLALSTPRGKTGFFYEKWTAEDAPWERINAKACDCPRISPERLAEQRETLGERGYACEFENEFLEDTDQVFTESSIEAIFDDDGLGSGCDGIDLEAV
jgi:hypothetical protein